MNGTVNVPGASAADLALVRTTAEGAATDAAAALAAAGAAYEKAEEAIEKAEEAGGGCQLLITFASDFAGRPFTVAGGGESYAGTVPDGLVASVNVKNCNTAYTITSSTAAGVSYSASVVTGPYFGQYTAALSAFTATLTVTARAGAAVRAVSGGTEYTATAESDGKARLTIKKSGTYTVTATLDGATSNSATANVTTAGSSYTATVKFIVLTVTVDAGSEITVQNGSTTKTATSTGSNVFILPNTGTWTVTATKDGKTASGSVNASSYADYSLALTYVSTTLNSNSWQTIKEVSDAGQGANYWNVGDTKDIVINGKIGSTTITNLTVKAFILGFNHNSSKEGNNRIHFQIGKIGTALVGLVDSKYGNTGSTGNFVMNTTNTNSGGWESSYMRKTILGNTNTPASPLANSFMAALPSDLRAVMKSVTKYSDNTGGGSDTASYVKSTTDYLFLLAEFEYHGARSYANSAEKNYQAQYAYYQAGNSKVHNKHSATTTAAAAWCRSVYASDGTDFCRVYTGGTANGYDAYYSYALAPGFCV